ncbi:hypothetical protein HZC53_02185 [Candidatus Uhrbacteria bacterium]|nr:hypothetical protein [Candidatus Uhrbacteria bacterium]
MTEKQSALHQLGRDQEGVSQLGEATEIVACWGCLAESICDDFAPIKAMEALMATCPSGRATMIGFYEVQRARNGVASCFRYQLPTAGFKCQ